MLIAFQGRTDLQVSGKNRVGRRQGGTEQNSASERHPGQRPSQERNCRDRQGHDQEQQAYRRLPAPVAPDAVDAQSGGKQHDDNDDFAHGLPDMRIGSRIERPWHAR